jgi:hypothetical protein
LQDQDRCHAINRLATLFDGKLGFTKQAVCLSRGEALVPEVDGEFEALAEIFDKGVGLFRLDAFGARHAKGQADHNLPDVVFANEAFQVGEVVPLVPAMQSIEALGRDSKAVRNGDADSAGAEIKAENTARCIATFMTHGDIIRFSLWCGRRVEAGAAAEIVSKSDQRIRSL